MQAMDHGKFDRLTRLFGAPGSRRTALRALLGAALFGATTRPAAAAPTSPCGTRNQDYCGRECCPGKCFVRCDANGEEFCCDKPDWVMCGNTCCQYDPNARDPCEKCPPGPPGGAEVCVGYVGGSYRRR
jgi:hypothetical protein